MGDDSSNRRPEPGARPTPRARRGRIPDRACRATRTNTACNRVERTKPGEVLQWRDERSRPALDLRLPTARR